jgi:hypothetical protein
MPFGLDAPIIPRRGVSGDIGTFRLDGRFRLGGAEKSADGAG